MEIKTIKISGMTCQHCVMQVKKELAKVSSVKDVKIGQAVVEVDPATANHDNLTTAVANAGYEVVSIS